MKPWQCIAELVDNAIDGYLKAPESWKKENSGPMKIEIFLPTMDELKNSTGKLVVRDHGPGMDKETMTKAVKAGWRSGAGYDRLGQFGMGFNIATANLGAVTKISSGKSSDTQFNWIDIDTKQMRRHRLLNPDEPFMANDGAAPKESSHIDQGTKVEITNLKQNMVSELLETPSTNENHLRNKLGRIYTRILEENNIRIMIHSETSGKNGYPVKVWKHCVWDKKRSGVFTPFKSKQKDQISCKEEVNIPLKSQHYCGFCWEWFDDESDFENGNDCPVCEREGTITKRDRVIKGWIGVQRFFSSSSTTPKEHFGIDLERNGRVIETLVKDFFEGSMKDGSVYTSYPVEGPGNPGRIVGVLDISFCPTEPTKSQFTREDENWKLIFDEIAGKGMQPKKVEDEWGEGEFVSTPLTKMVRTFGSGKFTQPFTHFFQQLVPGKIEKKQDGSPKLHPSNDLPYMSVDFSGPRANYKKFRKGDKDFQSDELWWQEVLEADDFNAEEYYKEYKKEKGIEDPETCPHDKDPSKCSKCKKKKKQRCKHGWEKDACPKCAEEVPEDWELDEELSGEYSISEIDTKIVVQAFVDNNIKGTENPMKIKRVKGQQWQASFTRQHPIFSSFKEDPKEYLLMELASSFSKMSKSMKKGMEISECYMVLKKNYCEDQKIDPKSVEEQSSQFLEKIRKKLVTLNLKGESYSEDLRSSVVQSFELKHESKKVAEEALSNGTFVNHITASLLFEEILNDNVQLLSDGEFFKTPVVKASSRSTRDTNRAELEIALRQVCTHGPLNNKGYEDLLAISTSIKRLESWMV